MSLSHTVLVPIFGPKVWQTMRSEVFAAMVERTG